MKGRTTPTAGCGTIVFQLKDVKRTRREITEYADPLTVIKVSLTAGGQHHGLRLVLRDDARAFFEVGGDEIRIVDVAEVQPSVLKFGGRFRFEWWSKGRLYISFTLDEFEVVE